MSTRTELLNQSPAKFSFVLAAAGIIMIVLAFIIGISDNAPGILLLLIGACTLLYSLIHKYGATAQLSRPLKLLYWAPRVLSIVFIAFTSLFAMDVFEESKDFWQLLTALFMHLIPVLIMIVILLFSWKWEWLGGVLFSLVGILYIITNWGRFPFLTYALIAGPLFITGILFALNWIYRAKLKTGE